MGLSNPGSTSYTAAAASRSTSLAVSAGTPTDIGFDTQLVDTSGFHSTSVNNQLFKAPVAGAYRFHLLCSATVAATFLYAFCVVNSGGGSAGWSLPNSSSTSDSLTVTASTVVALNAGDTVKWQLYSQAACTIVADGSALNAGSGFCRAWIERIA